MPHYNNLQNQTEFSETIFSGSLRHIFLNLIFFVRVFPVGLFDISAILFPFFKCTVLCVILFSLTACPDKFLYLMTFHGFHNRFTVFCMSLQTIDSDFNTFTLTVPSFSSSPIIAGSGIQLSNLPYLLYLKTVQIRS